MRVVRCELAIDCGFEAASFVGALRERLGAAV
jgi:hypothetical protein